MSDQYQIKFSGSAEIQNPLSRDKDFVIAGEWEEHSRTEIDQKDGSTLTSFKVAPLRLMQITESGEKVRLKTKNKNSVRIRAAVFREQAKRSLGMVRLDEDTYYDMFTDKLINNLGAVLDLLEL